MASNPFGNISGFGGSGGTGGMFVSSMQGWHTSTVGQGPSMNINNKGGSVDGETTAKKQQLNVKNVTQILSGVLKTQITPFLWGPPGIGKSTLVKKLAAANKWELIDLRLSLLNPVDLRGLPHINNDTHEAQWLPPSFLPPYNTRSKGILFLDEINLAPISVQHAAYQLILDKEIGDYRFPKSWRIIAAGNRETDGANAYKMPTPLLNRFIHFEVTHDISTWKDWARGRLRAEVVNFVAQRPMYLFQMPTNGQKAYPTPRSWEFLSKMLDAFSYDGEDKMSVDLQQVIMGTVGEGVGQEFIKTIEQMRERQIDKKIADFIDTGKLKMPKELSFRYALITAAYNAYREDKMTPKRYKEFVELLHEEEKATIQAFEKKYADETQERYGGPKPSTSATSVKLLKAVTFKEKELDLSSTKPFTNNEEPLLIFDAAGHKELVEWDTKGGGGKLILSRRGTQGTTARDWDEGTLVQVFQGDWK